jgi:hypothetical protein
VGAKRLREIIFGDRLMSKKSDHARQTGPAVEAMYQFNLWLVPTVERFPRSQKFLLGDRIQSTALDVMERLEHFVIIRGHNRLR